MRAGGGTSPAGGGTSPAGGGTVVGVKGDVVPGSVRKTKLDMIPTLAERSSVLCVAVVGWVTDVRTTHLNGSEVDGSISAVEVRAVRDVAPATGGWCRR